MRYTKWWNYNSTVNKKCRKNYLKHNKEQKQLFFVKNLVKTICYLTPENIQMLDELAKEEDVSRSEIMRKIFNELSCKGLCMIQRKA